VLNGEQETPIRLFHCLWVSVIPTHSGKLLNTQKKPVFISISISGTKIVSVQSQ